MVMFDPEASELNETRCLRLIHRAINVFGLDLSGLIVLTEAATGYYALTPLIAALAGAKHVYALTRDSRYGSAFTVQAGTMTLASSWCVADRVTVLFSRQDGRLGTADIVTNLGFVRPLDAAFLGRLKSTVAISLMWETWEYRPQELDLDACRRLGIVILGTDEHHPALQTMRYVGLLALKLLFELEIEVLSARVVVVGGGEFGNHATAALRTAGAEVTQLAVGGGKSLLAPSACDALRGCDAVVVAEHCNDELLIGPGGQLTATQLYELSPGVCVIHIAGGVDRSSLEAAGILCKPEQFAPVGHMSVTTDYLGPRPLIDLHTAGLKVGEALARARLGGALPNEAESLVLSTCRLAQGFEDGEVRS